MSASPAPAQGEFTREELSKELLHDYSTSSTGVVPLSERRSLYHFLALWVTLAAGFTYLFLGFQYHDSGYGLGRGGRRRRSRGAVLSGLRAARLLPRLPHRADARAANPLDLRGGRIGDRVAAADRGGGRVDRVRLEPAGGDVRRPVQLGAPGADRGDPGGGRHLQQPVRLHRHHRVRS